MPQTATHAPGKFCWIEIGTTDKAAARKFYTKLLGWGTKDMPAGEMGTYTMVTIDGHDVGGLWELPKEQREQGVPPHWLAYVSVEDATAATDRAEKLGAEVVMGPMDVMDVGRMSVLNDPQGATFAVWQPKAHHGFGVVADPGAPCWFELLTNDTSAAADFYRGVFGWGVEDSKMPGMQYSMFKRGEESVGGLMALTPQMKGAPPCWIAYITVKICDATAKEAAQLGAKVLAGPQEVPQMGRFALLQDPTGAVFGVFEFAEFAQKG